LQVGGDADIADLELVAADAGHAHGHRLEVFLHPAGNHGDLLQFELLVRAGTLGLDQGDGGEQAGRQRQFFEQGGAVVVIHGFLATKFPIVIGLQTAGGAESPHPQGPAGDCAAGLLPWGRPPHGQFILGPRATNGNGFSLRSLALFPPPRFSDGPSRFIDIPRPGEGRSQAPSRPHRQTHR